MTGSTDLLAPVVVYYDKALRSHGPTARGVDWNSSESQSLRFEQLLKVCRSMSDISLNDYGCGYGALLDFLPAVSDAVSYCGFDITPGMLAEARKRHPEANFVDDEDALAVADYTVASGIFNVRLDADEDAWRRYMFATIQAMADRSRLGFAFNALSSYADATRMKPYLHYSDPLAVFDHCKRHVSWAVTLLHDYPLFEFTILVRL